MSQPAKVTEEDVQRAISRGKSPLPFIVTRGVGAPASGPSGSLAEQIANERRLNREMTAWRLDQEAEEARLRRTKLEEEAGSLRAAMELEKLKQGGQNPADGRGPVAVVKDSLEVVKLAGELKGGSDAGSTALVQALMANQMEFQRMVAQLQRDSQAMQRELQRDAEKAKEAGFLKYIELLNQRLNDLSKAKEPSKNLSDQIRETMDLAKMLGLSGEQRDRKAELLLEEFKANATLQTKQMDLAHQRWLEEARGQSELIKTAVIVFGQPVANALQPALAKAAEGLGDKIGARMGANLSGAQGAQPQGPRMYPIQVPPGVDEFEIPCPCGNKFLAKAGADAYVCEKCRTVYKPG